ncbi:MAG: class I SAM-dependent methyltransferase [Rhizobiales bacterium]|nr:class I SAM-dependent methyltransferase [Hyphomicrobiales bacterium]
MLRPISWAEIFKGGELAAFAGDPLILAVLESDKNVDLGLERLLTSVRAGLLHVVVSLGAMELPNNTLPLCCALAQQCFINEYVWGLTDKEAEEVAILNDRLTNALQERSPVSPFIVAMLAAYKPLIDVSGARRLLKQALPQAMAQLLDQQLSRPAERLSDEKSIRRLTAINNETSIAVKTQYEENPYPRWVRLAAIEPPQPIDDWFQATFPSSPFRRLDKPEALDVLVAGCGTGHHALLFAKSFPMAHILAIDLSLPSLSYARQKTREIGIGNVEYAQADILEIGNIGRTFDVISSSGVLHHLADPLEGWRRLLSLLRPNGLMHVGLYSELARRNVAAARNWLAESGHPSVETVDDLRRSRQHLLAFAHDHSALADVLRYPDFYSTSEYRDLLFHRQERDFDIPEIGRFLEENKLRFIGFNVGAAVRAEFRRSVSEERESDLTAWHEFETGHPHVFQGMYQFWVQRIEP